MTGDQEVQIGVFHLGLGGVDDEGRAVVGDDAANADGAQGALERVGQAQSRELTRRGQGVGVVLTVVAHHKALDLHLVDEPFGEQRTDGPVHSFAW